MDPRVKAAIETAVVQEPFARSMGIELLNLEDGYSLVEMVYNPSRQNNIYGRAHGGAMFGLIDEAFETAGQTDGTVAVAMNVNVTYISSPEPGVRLRAEARARHGRPINVLGIIVPTIEAATGMPWDYEAERHGDKVEAIDVTGVFCTAATAMSRIVAIHCQIVSPPTTVWAHAGSRRMSASGIIQPPSCT